MRNFDYTFIKNMFVPTYFLSTIEEIVSFKTKATYLIEKNPSIFISLSKSICYNELKAVNLASNLKIDNKRLKEIVFNQTVLTNNEEKNVKGYKEMFDFAISTNIEIDNKSLRFIHSSLYKYTNNTNIGSYRTTNYLNEEYIDNIKSLRFSLLPADNIVIAINDISYAFKEAIEDININKLIFIPCLLLDLLLIEPFDEGNEEIMKLLLINYLNNIGIDIFKYISLTKILNKHKREYFESLKQSSLNWNTNSNSYLPFINFILNIILDGYKELARCFVSFDDVKITKEKRIEKILLNASKPMSKSDIKELLPDVAIITIEKTLAKLMKEKKIFKHGKTNGVKYLKNGV